MSTRLRTPTGWTSPGAGGEGSGGGIPGLIDEDVDGVDIPAGSKAQLFVDSDGSLQGRNEFGSDVLVDLRKINGRAFSNWRAALAGRDFVPAGIMCVGDSMSEGFGQTSFDRRFLSIFRRGLQGEYKEGGEGYLPILSGATMTFTQPWTIAGTPDQNEYGWGTGRRAVVLNTTDDILTRNFYGDRVFVHYTGGAALGTMKITIDGIVSTHATGNPDFLTLSGRVWDSGQLLLGTHTLRIEPNAASNTIVIDGTTIFNTDYSAGIHLFECARSGLSTPHFSGTDALSRYWADIMFQPHTSILSNTLGVTGNGTTTITWTGGVFDANDVGEVVWSGTDIVAFPRGCRVVSVTNATTLVLNKIVPAGTYTCRITRSRVTNAVTINGSILVTSATMAFNPWDVGKTVSGTNIQAGSVIKRVLSPTDIWIDKVATASGSGLTLQIKNRQKYPMRANLFMIELGLNDLAANLTKATYKANLIAIFQTMVDNAQIDLPTMTGIYNDETPSVGLLGLWAPSHITPAGLVRVATINGSALITEESGAITAPRFTQDDVGKSITTAGNTPIPAGTTILSVEGPNDATLSQNAVATNGAALATIVNRQAQDESWQEYRAAQYELSIERDWVFFDLYNLGGWIGDYDTRQLTYDYIHPNDRGAQWIADELSTAIGGNKSTGPISRGVFNNPGEMIVAAAADLVRVSPGKKVITAANLTNSSNTTWVDIPELAFSIGPGDILTFFLTLQYFAAATTTGITISFTGPASPTWFYASGLGGGATAATTINFSGTNALSTGVISALSAVGTADTAPGLIIVKGSIKAGVLGGTVLPRFRSEINASLVTVLKGSDILVL